MKLSPPRKITFYVAIGFGVLSLLSKVVPSLWEAGIAGWFALIAFGLLAAGNLFEGL